MTYIVFDLEATCWAQGDPDCAPPEAREIIEIGAVRLGPDLAARDEYDIFVRPVVRPLLSCFCKSLTSISQSNVDKAADFKAVLPDFLRWIGPGPVTTCSWGAYDMKQLALDCRRHGLTLPELFSGNLNLKEMFAAKFDCRPCGMSKALRKLNILLDGTHHRGIDDARNIAKIARLILSPDSGGLT